MNNNKVIWKCSNFQSSYTFSNPDRAGWWIKNFMKFVKSCEVYNKPATRRGFFKITGKPEWKARMNTFFSAMKEAGIVTATKKWNGKFTECLYTIGPNRDAYLEGRLVRYNYKLHSHRYRA